MLCACESPDAYECWAERYNLGVCDLATVEESGGPCKCSCHDKDFDDEDEEQRRGIDEFVSG